MQLYAQHSGRKGNFLFHQGFEASVVATKNRYNEHVRINTGSYNHGVRLFFSFPLVLPIIVLFLCWYNVFGARVYIRTYMNETKNYPTLAALYWIGQTFTLFVIVMDILATARGHQKEHINSSTYDEKRGLVYYQYWIVIIVCAVECVSLIASIVHVVLLCVNQWFYKDDKTFWKGCLLGWFNYLCSPIFCCIKIKSSEARLWLSLSGFIPPIIALSSHAGYIVGGWISYENRSIAIILFFLFVFIFLFWSLQHAYLFSLAFLRIKKKQFVSEHHNNRYYPLQDFSGDNVRPYQAENSEHERDNKRQGFNFTALLLMFPTVVLFDCIIVYIGFGILYLPLLESIDDALDHIYIFGQYVFIFVVFLLTYNLLSLVNEEHHHNNFVTDGTLKFWRFLRGGSYHGFGYRKQAVVALQHAAIHIRFAAEYFQKADHSSEIDVNSHSSTRTTFRNALASFQEAVTALHQQPPAPPPAASPQQQPAPHPVAPPPQQQPAPPPPAPPQQQPAAPLQQATQSLETANTNFETAINNLETVADFDAGIGKLQETEKHLQEAAEYLDLSTCKVPPQNVVKALKKALKYLKEGVQPLLQTSDDIPSTYLKKDKADALMATLMFRTTDAPLNTRYALLMSLIEEDCN